MTARDGDNPTDPDVSDDSAAAGRDAEPADSRDGIEAPFIENDDPEDGELSVTSMGKVAGPLRRPKREEPLPREGRESLGTPNLGSHVMD